LQQPHRPPLIRAVAHHGHRTRHPLAPRLPPPRLVPHPRPPPDRPRRRRRHRPGRHPQRLGRPIRRDRHLRDRRHRPPPHRNRRPPQPRHRPPPHRRDPPGPRRRPRVLGRPAIPCRRRLRRPRPRLHRQPFHPPNHRPRTRRQLHLRRLPTHLPLPVPDHPTRPRNRRRHHRNHWRRRNRRCPPAKVELLRGRPHRHPLPRRHVPPRRRPLPHAPQHGHHRHPHPSRHLTAHLAPVGGRPHHRRRRLLVDASPSHPPRQPRNGPVPPQNPKEHTNGITEGRRADHEHSAGWVLSA